MGLFNHILQMCLPTEWPRQPFQAEEVDLSFTPHTVSHQQRADSPLWTKNSHLTLPLGFVTRAFGWVRPQGTKKTKIERKKKKLALKEIRSPNNYKLTLVLTAYC